MLVTSWFRDNPILNVYPRALIRLFGMQSGFCLLLAVVSLHSYAAEEDLLLSISGDLIDVVKTVGEDTEPAIIIDTYYSELENTAKEEAASLRRNLTRLIPNYEIAYAAADTAEMNSVLSEVGYHWAVLRTFHAKHFTDQARAELYRAYVEQYLLLD